MGFVLIVVQVLIDLVMLGLLVHYLYRQYRPGQKPIIYKEFLELQDNIAELTLELEKVSKQTLGELEGRIERLNALIAAADKRLVRMPEISSKTAAGSSVERPLRKRPKPVREVRRQSQPVHRPVTAGASGPRAVLPTPISRTDPTTPNTPGSPVLPDDPHEKISLLHARGLSVKEIARQTRLNEGEVQLIVNLKSRKLI